MLRLSKKADYALIAMKHLAQKHRATSTCAREIAEQYDIPIELMAKVLQRLVRNRLLVSTQGTRGGYTLGRAPSSISVADVIEAIDGPFTVTACTSDKHDCEQYSKCSVRDPLWQIRERIAATLGTVTLADMAAEPDPVVTSPVAVVRKGA
ncbi:MAG TPA: SUF system Fe-S cluster assembly regulator [Vicinamibacterales bacterium]|jgi:Rrf2 family protein|nr:SUF system Fe-S cluster assembly regulator [Vicinamibacterales bacterium]